MKKSPLAQVKEKFGDKAGLIKALEPLTSHDLCVSRLHDAKELAHVSNAKLLKLYYTLSIVKERFGNRDKLIETILEMQKRVKDTGYRARLSTYPIPRLYDLFRSLLKREKAMEKKKEAQQAASQKAS
ncbi:hypothetical protein [Pajaroellobacter abortibovis]|uniref:Uncharacterized protein n=1 Tax=Pajaroellobacter abortibovis TaxID=1882918 RepID=A0A1L6MYI8_9BACT|nr:hypothetical protein [Pajaroellobacter abortibovis]APS00641.1 hypothetical protein BCY86_08120 [Pajaroellobacter abortibovis]